MGLLTHKIRIFLFLILLFIDVIAKADMYDDDTTLDYSWEPSSGAVDHYNVFVSIDGGAFEIVGTTSTPSYPLTGAINGATYRLRVQAVDAAGNTGLFSDESDPTTVNIDVNISVNVPAANAGQNVTLTSDIVLLADATSVTLYYKKGGESSFSSVPFSLQSGILQDGSWSATIPADDVTLRGLLYYVEVVDANTDTYSDGSAENPNHCAVSGSTTITVKTTPAGSGNVWNIVAPSVIPNDTSVINVFSSFGGFAQTWIAWRWNPTAEQWEVPQAHGSSPVSSDGFDVATSWLFAVDGDGGDTTFDVAGTSVDCSRDYSITLQTGWNLIANPFDYNVAWSDATLIVRYGGEDRTPTQAEAAGLVDNRAIWYDSTQRKYVTYYSNAAESHIMPPHRGQWLYSAISGAELVIPPIKANASQTASIVRQQKNSGRFHHLLPPGLPTAGIIVIGDVNGDGRTTPQDGKLVLQFVAGLIPLNPTQRLAADVDGNGSINAYDANLILRYITGLYFPVEE